MQEKIYSAIPMQRFGINIIAITEHKDLDFMRQKFINDPDWSWCGGLGKKYMHSMLKQNLLLEDSYFESCLEEAIETNQRWIDFINDCVIFAVLDEVITNNPLLLLHPSCVEKNLHPKMPPLQVKVSLIDGIEILH